MAEKDPNKDIVKRRILILRQLLLEQTDEDHPLSTFEILEYLQAQGTPANRKTLKSDLSVLESTGDDIVTLPGKPNRYYYGERVFEMPELKLLIDAVSSSRFITQKKSKELGQKLMGFAGKNQREELERHIYATHRVKATNERIYYTVDSINEAITDGKKIAFQYMEYDGNKTEVLRNDGEMYELSPYALFWNEDFYYVVGYSEKHGNVSAFRADRLRHVKMMDEDALPAPKDFSLDDYSRRIFEMFDGDEVQVKLECRNELMKYVIDRFGEDVPTRPLDSEHFLATVDVALSPTFYAWVFRFGGDIKITSPGQAVTEISQLARRILKSAEK